LRHAAGSERFEQLVTIIKQGWFSHRSEIISSRFAEKPSNVVAIGDHGCITGTMVMEGVLE
jgi:hypothetical protein